MKKTKTAKVTVETDNYEVSFKIKNLSNVDVKDLESFGDSFKSIGGMIPFLSGMLNEQLIHMKHIPKPCDLGSPLNVNEVSFKPGIKNVLPCGCISTCLCKNTDEKLDKEECIPDIVQQPHPDSIIKK